MPDALCYTTRPVHDTLCTRQALRATCLLHVSHDKSSPYQSLLCAVCTHKEHICVD
uniref:Uncharacterized protein n=1 Tax=Anguilla anguilla TaxID=7936 RepID=A0A0E9V9U5_ANGAN